MYQVEVAKQAYYQAEVMDDEEEDDEEGDDEDESANPRDVGHNIYILAHQVSHQNINFLAVHYLFYH